MMTEHNPGRASPSPCHGMRSRNAALTRQAILDAARRCFAHEGYDQVGVRDIAALAGIDPSLVNRYFGSKEGLFAEAFSAKFDVEAIFAGDRATLGERLVRYVLNKSSSGDEHDPLVALLRSSGSDVTGHLFRKALSEGFIRPLAARLDGADARERAELIGAMLLGLLVYQIVIGRTPPRQIEHQVALTAPVVQAVIDGDGITDKRTLDPMTALESERG